MTMLLCLHNSFTDLVTILSKFCTITELVIWNQNSTLLEERVDIGNIHGDRLLPNLTMLRLMDCGLEITDLVLFLQRRAEQNLSCPTIECMEVRDAGIPMDIAGILDSVTGLSRQFSRHRNVDIVQVTDWLSKLQISLAPDVSQWLQEEFIRFAPERQQSSWRLLHQEARRGLRAAGFWPWEGGGGERR